MKITDFKNEEALDLLSDILEPTAKIIGDPKLSLAVKNKANKITVIRLAIKNHKPEVIEILARLNGKKPEEYSCNIITITAGLMDLLNDEELMDFFVSQAQTKDVEPSTFVTANTGEEEA